MTNYEWDFDQNDQAMDRIAGRLDGAPTDEELVTLDTQIRLLFRSMRKGIGADHLMLQRLFGLANRVGHEQERRRAQTVTVADSHDRERSTELLN